MHFTCTCDYVLPFKVFFISHTAKESCEELLKELQEPLEVLSGYTERMEKELKQRNEIEEMLDSFIWSHQCLLHKAKERRKVRDNQTDNVYRIVNIVRNDIISVTS